MRIDVASGKLLGLIGFKKRCWGIEVDPAKIQAILDMPPQKTVKEVQSLKEEGLRPSEDSFQRWLS